MTHILASHDINWWTGVVWITVLVDYCDVCISCLDSNSDGTHSLQSIHCWESDAMLHFSKPDEETNSSTSWMVYIFSQFSFLCELDLANTLMETECIPNWIKHSTPVNCVYLHSSIQILWETKCICLLVESKLDQIHFFLAALICIGPEFICIAILEAPKIFIQCHLNVLIKAVNIFRDTPENMQLMSLSSDSVDSETAADYSSVSPQQLRQL